MGTQGIAQFEREGCRTWGWDWLAMVESNSCLGWQSEASSWDGYGDRGYRVMEMEITRIARVTRLYGIVRAEISL
jgi:hypothetical protein